MMRLYNAALLPIRLLLSLWGGWRSRDPEGAVRWNERLGRRLPDGPTGGVWIHGASVGEARIATALAAALRRARPALPLALSATTPTGRNQLPGTPAVDTTFFMPFDFPGLPTRVLERLLPNALVLIETELWPNLLSEAHRARLPVVVVNGRLSEQRMRSYRRLRPLYRPLLSRLAAVGAQSTADADRFVALGVPPNAVEVTGNVKYDLAVEETDPEQVRGVLGLASRRPVFVAGSTAAGEDALVLSAFERARTRHPDLFLILAPRHPERADDVEQLVRSRGLDCRRTTERPEVGGRDVLLVDEVGQLARLYSIGTVAFVGGSLVPRGGHNVLEPAAVGVPVVFGPHTESVSEPAEELVRRGAAIRVEDADELGRVTACLITDRERANDLIRAAREVVRTNRGALDRSVELIESRLASSRVSHAEDR